MRYPNCPLAHGIPNYIPKMFLVTTNSVAVFQLCLSSSKEQTASKGQNCPAVRNADELCLTSSVSTH